MENTEAGSPAQGISHLGVGSEAGGAPGRKPTLDIRYIVAAIRSNLGLIGIIVGGVLALTIIVTLLQVPSYTAKSTLQINNSGARVLNASKESDLDTNEDSGGNDTELFLKTQVDILKSRGMAVRVGQKLKLFTNPHFFESEGATPPAAEAQPAEIHDEVLGLLSKKLNVDLPRDSRILSLSFVSSDPQLSAAIANAYATEFIQANLQRRFDSSAYARDFLSNQLTEVKQRLEESERALNTYSRSAGLIRTDSSGGDSKDAHQSSMSVTTSSLLQLNTAANEAMAKRIEVEGRWESLNHGPLLSSSEVLGNAAISQLIEQKATIQAELEQERARHFDDYPTVKAKQQQLAAINAQIQLEATNIRNSVHADYNAALQTEHNLMGSVQNLKNETLSEQDLGVKYNLLAREVDTNRQVYDGLLQRFKDLNASAGISISNVSIIDTADVPLRPTSPNVTMNLLVGLLIGVLLAGGTVIVKDYFDDSIRVPEDIEAKINLALLGVIPKSSSGNPQDELGDPKSGLTEAYNSLRGSLLYARSDGLPPTLLVTSAQASEGKSTTSYAVAAGFARIGKRVLLIDADMRRPSLHRLIDSDNERGFSNLLTSQDALSSAALPGGVDNLMLITSGPIPPSPTELIASPRFKMLLEEATRSFDLVVIDSPPILGLADAPLMSAMVGGVVFVVEADRGRHGSLRSALRRILAMRAPILGAVLTKFDPFKRNHRYYSSYYGYEYYQYQYQYNYETQKRS